ncbi:MAG: hypothetical protein ACRDJL_00650, partial [Actinomycetota bacterium]
EQMSKNKKRKQRKAKPKGPNQRARRQIEQRVESALDQLFGQAGDERVPAEDPARAFLSAFSTEPVFDELVGTLVQSTSAERASAIGEAAVKLEPRSIGALTFAAQAAEFANEDRRCAELYTRALELDVGHEPELRWCRAAALISCNDGRATGELAELCAQDPHDDLFESLYCDAIEVAAERLALGQEGPCPCGSDLIYGSCCFERDRAALADFQDASQLEELWGALDDYAQRERYADSVNEMRARFFEGEQVEPTEAMNELLRAWLVTITGSELDDDIDEATIFWDLLRDEEVDPSLRATAASVGTGERWGLWQLGPRRGPGVWFRDLVTASAHFVALPAEGDERHAPWSVFLGPLTPYQGKWTGRAMISLTPQEGDALADAVLELADTIVEKEGIRREKSAIPFTDLVQEGPPGVLVTRRLPVTPQTGFFLSNVICGVLPLLLEELGRMRAQPIGLANTDGDPLEFFNVRIEVGDLDELRVALDDHPDFRVEEHEFMWLGRAMTGSEAATSRAELEAYAEREGVELMDQPDESPRYTRAFIKVVDDALVTEVNSAARLDSLIELLQEMGARPRLTSKVGIDPALDFPPPGSVAPSDDRGMSAEAIAAWQEAWLDEEVPRSGGSRRARRPGTTTGAWTSSRSCGPSNTERLCSAPRGVPPSTSSG